MFRKASVLLISILMISSMLLAACQPAPTPVVQTVKETVVVMQAGTPVVITATPAPTTPPQPGTTTKVLRMSLGASDVPSIDPSHAQSVDEIQVIEATSLSVVRQNEETTELEKSLATDYKVSDDGLVYTFTLPTNVPWVKYDANKGEVVKVQDCNGKDRMVTADDFVYGILRTLDPRTASEYAYVLTPYLVGANDLNSAPITDTAKIDDLRAKVGVKAIDAQTIQYSFVSPAVYNLNILGLWVTRAEPQWLIAGDDCTDARSDRWTEAGLFQGYGPYTLKEWSHDYNLTLIKNPFWPGTKEVPQAKIDEIQYKFLDTSTALAEFEAGNLDISGIPTGDMDRIKTDPKFKDMIRQVVTLGTELYGFQTTLAPTDDVRVRQALSFAIDRQSLVDNVVKSGIPAYWYTNPGVAGGPKEGKYPDLAIKYDPVKAKQLLDEYLKEKNTTADKLQITLMYNTAESNKKAAEAIQQMWKDNLGITVSLKNQERKVYYKQRTEGTENVYRLSWVQDYPDANNFLFEVFGPGGGFQNIVKWDLGDNYTKFVDLLKQAAVEKDPAKRMDLYAQADKILIFDEAAVTPLWWYSTPVLVQPNVKDLNSITGYDHYEKWDITQ
jgi:oligopeptide transport system substrate-binding protein